MAFSISLLLEPVPDLEPGVKASLGLIKIGSFQERFSASLMYWNAEDYERHWKQAVARIIKSSAVSCLITSMLDPATANFIFWWPMYCEGDTVFIQNQILFLDQLPSPFDEHAPFSHVPERKILSEDGEKISEWFVSIKDLESFLRESKP